MEWQKKNKFLKPDDEWATWQEDRQDVNKESDTTFVYNGNTFLSFDEQRKRLPIFKKRLEILYAVQKYQTLVLVGDTGCGKSTQVPQYLLESGWCENGLKICVTEPRRFCATSLANRVAEERGESVGKSVGYAIRFDDCQSEATKIKYMTEGILIREMMADPLLRDYSVVMLDEVHERNTLTDILMGLLKKILKKRTRLKLIVASATVDAVFLKNFFERNVTSDQTKDTSCIVSAEGRLYPVIAHYLKEPIADYVMGVVDCIRAIHEKEGEGDILAFLTGSEEVARATSLLKDGPDNNEYLKMFVLPMYGSLPNSEQLKVFRPTPRGMRKIVVATNIAETSVTIAGIVYVVDCGFVKLRWFNAETYTDSLIVVPISKASAEQRAGRAGRLKLGKVFRLYPEIEFDKLSDATPPEMSRTDLSEATLQLKALGIDNVLRFAFPSPPPAKNLSLALELLYAAEAIDDKGSLTKPLGVAMAEFPLSPLHSKTLLNSTGMGCEREICAILAMLQVDNVFIKPYSGADAIKARIEKRKFEVAEGDLITLLNVFEAFEQYQSNKSWCHQHYVNFKAMKRASAIKGQMTRMLERYRQGPVVQKEVSVEDVCKCVASGFFPNAAYLHYSGVYKTVRGDQELYIHPTSVLYTVVQPQWVLYHELIHTDKIYMRDVTVIESKWLRELAPHYYHMASH